MAKKFFNYHKRDDRNDRNDRNERRQGQFFDRKKDERRNDGRDQRESRADERRDSQKKEVFHKKQHGHSQFVEKIHEAEKKIVEKLHIPKKMEVLGKCYLCQSNVADEIYSLSIGDEDKKFVHFECMVKRVKQKAQKDFPKVNNYKVYYIGNGTFAAVVEKYYKGMQWEILFKMNIKEILPPPVNELQKSTS